MPQNRTKYIIATAGLLLFFCWYIYPTTSVKKNDTETTINKTKVIAEEISPPTPPKLPNKEFKKIINSYDHIIDSILKKNGTLGAAIAIIHNNKIKYINCHGLKNSKTKEPIDQHTVFRLASVSKAVSGILAGLLIEEDFIHLEDKVVDYLPNFELIDSTSTQNLNIMHLLTHTSGMVPHAFDNLIEDNVSYARVIDKLNEVNVYASPGKLYGYQNVAFSLLDTITEVATNTSFEDLIESYVFTPFCMQDASVGFEPFSNNKNKAYPHRKIGNKRFAQLKLNDHYYNTIPAAGINASLQDMSKFIQAILSTNKSSQSSLTETVFTPRINTPLRRSYLSKWGKVQSKHYGLGWRIIGYQDHSIAYHGGYVNGYKTEIAICEEEDFGIVYLSNSPDTSASFSVPTFLKLYFEATAALEPKIDNSGV
ncbi:serine hydrolase domain-containing protein [Flavicella sediminum]|uniref:serine hydrolase domain-containing protein n=1 Tax=Flavicella sediminum TaxID=2585141 RepID=UPI00111F9D0F|nr:serine hydrolase domain-containing protein [Flavicella sediminum]